MGDDGGPGGGQGGAKEVFLLLRSKPGTKVKERDIPGPNWVELVLRKTRILEAVGTRSLASADCLSFCF